MTSIKQFEANRRNSLKSTGPKTEAGKQASRCNAVRHGLTAETVIGALEDAEDYRAFEAAVTADYDARGEFGSQCFELVADAFSASAPTLTLVSMCSLKVGRSAEYLSPAQATPPLA